MKAIRSPLRYPGGKSKALGNILPLVPPFKEFREPFIGGGSVFISLKQAKPNCQFWINDLNYDLYCFWHIAKTQLDELAEAVTIIYESGQDGRKLHHDYVSSQQKELNEFERAVRFFVLNRITFSGTVEAGGYSQGAFERRFTRSSIERLSMLAHVLPKTRITYGDYQSVIEAPGEDVFIFLDPPYYSATKSKLYGKKGVLHTNFKHERLAETLKNTNHNWLMTYDDCPEIRELYDFAYVRTWELQYGMNNYKQKNAAKGKEVFISNYQVEQFEQEQIRIFA